MPLDKDIAKKLSQDARVHLRGGNEYFAQSYQYGTTSHKEGDMDPAAVIYPGKDAVKDIQVLVKEACNNNFGISVRSGGHQYSGASSTRGDNILIDMSDAFEDFKYPSAENKDLALAGVSLSLDQMNQELRKRNLFVPHGQCLHVHLGGHVQTGGYGQLSRSFGLLSDHIEGFKIVLADGSYLSVWSPNSGVSTKDKKLNDDLYWAVLGGSPGNFGILTHVWLRPHKDKDHLDSRGMRDMNRYTKKRLENVLKVIAEMNDDNTLPRDFDICCTVMSNAKGAGYLEDLPTKDLDDVYLDEYMRKHHKEEYGDGVDGFLESDTINIDPGLALPVILIYLQWANVEAGGTFGEAEKRRFEKVKTALYTPATSLLGKLIDKTFKKYKDGVIAKLDWQLVNEEEHTPMSELTRYWCYENIREFVQPYEKRVYVTERKNLSQKDATLEKTWPEWATERIDEIMAGVLTPKTNLVVQIQPFGGQYSMFYKNGDPSDKTKHGVHGCHSWRRDLSLVQVMDYFYKPPTKETIDDPAKDTNLQIGLAWQEDNDTYSGPKGNGFFSKNDRRVLWGSYARSDDPDGGASLDSVHGNYFDTEQKYQDLVTIKERVDKDHIFTPNLFAVGANAAPLNRQLAIRGRGHKDTSVEPPPAKKAKKATGKKQ